MLKQHSSSNVDRVVRPFKMSTGGMPGGLDVPDDRASCQLVRAARPATPAHPCRPVMSVVEADSTAGWWSLALRCVMEGFVLYGAAIHPNAAYFVEAAPTTALARPPCPAGCQPQAVTHDQAGSQPSENGSVVAPEHPARVDFHQRRRWSCWVAIGEMAAVLLTHWRRGREIKRAAAALAKYDDRTLRDLGINGRTDIERVVRYCRDC